MKHQITNNTFLLILLFLFTSNHALSQGVDDGIYFKIDEKKCVFKKVKTKDSSASVCIPNNPIFLFEDIVWLSEIDTDAKTGTRKLVMELSKKGRDQLSVISKVYKGKDLVFVFNSRVAFLFRIQKAIISGKISIEENLEDSSLEHIRKKIEKILLQKKSR